MVPESARAHARDVGFNARIWADDLVAIAHGKEVGRRIMLAGAGLIAAIAVVATMSPDLPADLGPYKAGVHTLSALALIFSAIFPPLIGEESPETIRSLARILQTYANQIDKLLDSESDSAAVMLRVYIDFASTTLIIVRTKYRHLHKPHRHDDCDMA